jgi:hypothetical protein
VLGQRFFEPIECAGPGDLPIRYAVAERRRALHTAGFGAHLRRAAVARLRDAGLPLRVITNTTAKSRGHIGAGLRAQCARLSRVGADGAALVNLHADSARLKDCACALNNVYGAELCEFGACSRGDGCAPTRSRQSDVSMHERGEGL